MPSYCYMQLRRLSCRIGVTFKSYPFPSQRFCTPTSSFVSNSFKSFPSPPASLPHLFSFHSSTTSPPSTTHRASYRDFLHGHQKQEEDGGAGRCDNSLRYYWHQGGVVDVLSVPILSDNYAYIFIDKGTGRAGCVDPADPAKVLAVAASLGLSLEILLCTHHHFDHSGGNKDMLSAVSGLRVVCSGYEFTDGCTEHVKHKDKLHFGDTVEIEVLHAPCHTSGHVLYNITKRKATKRETKLPGNTGGDHDDEKSVLFSGDTLFVGGVGRFMEGTANDMVYALDHVVGQLPRETLVFCGHEYTVNNLRFALYN
eukprot:GHVS01076108.1.p1 GENE.GHVS01076108.1~~GHVS01076108.1.p1  ORF type:complete len:349 (+),score=59.95 GHVS01076108.1:115-1047(+)